MCGCEDSEVVDTHARREDVYCTMMMYHVIVRIVS